MDELEHDFFAERANCPGCGASLNLRAEQAVMQCQFCGSESKVERRLRRLIPEIPDTPPPDVEGDRAKELKRWGTAQLVHGVLNETDLAQRIAMAKALDVWAHVNDTMFEYLFHYVAAMPGTPDELDHAMRGIVGKMVCAKDMRYKQRAVLAGQRTAYANPYSKGLLFSLSLGDAATVKLLLDIAEWADSKGLTEYCDEALIGVRTAIGRERNYRHVCNQILIHRIPYVREKIRQWILYHLNLEFDVGYTQHAPWMIELIDDMTTENPDLVPDIQNAMRRGKGTRDVDDYLTRLRQLKQLRHAAARQSSLESLGTPRNELTPDQRRWAIDILAPFLDVSEHRETTTKHLIAYVWLNDGPAPEVLALAESLGDKTPKRLDEAIRRQRGERV